MSVTELLQRSAIHFSPEPLLTGLLIYNRVVFLKYMCLSFLYFIVTSEYSLSPKSRFTSFAFWSSISPSRSNSIVILSFAESCLIIICLKSFFRMASITFFSLKLRSSKLSTNLSHFGSSKKSSISLRI